MITILQDCQNSTDVLAVDAIKFRGVIERENTDTGLLNLLSRCMDHANILERSGLKRGGEDIRRLVRKFS